MDRWRGVLKVPLHPLSRTCYRVAASLCLSPTSERLIVPSANAIFFGGDRVAGTGNLVIERLSDLQNIAEILVSKIGGSVNAWVIEASDFNGPFAVYKDFIPSVNQWGEPKSYCPVGYPASGSIVSLLSNILEEVKNSIVRQNKLRSPGKSASHFTQPETLIFGFSKGGTVLNQIVTELGFSDIELSGGELVEEKKISMEEEIHIIPRTKETLLNSIREIHYVDVGLNSPGAYITDHSVIEKISKRLTQVDRGIRFILHGTPRQWRDSRRSWICNEKDKLVHLLESDAQRRGGKLQPGTLRFMRWVPNFSPACQRNTNAQVWVRLWDLGLEYWEAQTLFEITSGIGVPIRIDANTLDRKFGLYARVLVDIDLSTEPPLEIMVEREGGGTLVLEVEYEHLPLSCSHCGNVGHAINSCNWLRPSQAKEVKENDINSRRGRKRSQSRRHRAKKSNVFQVYVAKKVVEVVQQIGDPSSADPNASSGISRIVHNDMVETSQVPETQLSPLAAPSPRVHSPILGPPSVGGLAGIVAVPTVNAFQALANESETDSEGETTEIQSSDDVQCGADVIIEEDTISTTPSPKELPKDMAQSESDVHKAKFCWGDLENEEPLGNHTYAQAELSPLCSWFDEGEATVEDENLLKSLPKSQNKKLKSKRDSRDPYPTRNRTPVMRLDL